MLASIYGSPIILLLLVIRYRQKKMFNGILTVVLGLPLVALIIMIGYRFDLWQVGFEQDVQNRQIDEAFDRTSEVSRFYGARGEQFQLAGYTYTKYWFEFRDGFLELILPPGNVTAVAELNFHADAVPVINEASEKAQLWLLGSTARVDPHGEVRAQYFSEQLNVEAPSDTVLFIRLYAGDGSNVKYWVEDETGTGSWRHQLLILNLGAL